MSYYNEFEFKGTDYNTVMRKNVQNGGKITTLDITTHDNCKTVIITTDYADGLSISKEKLIYKHDILQSWTIDFNGQNEPKLIFLRQEYNQAKQSIKQNNNKKEILYI